MCVDIRCIQFIFKIAPTTTWGNIGLEKKKRTRTVPLEENIPCVDTRCIQFIFKITPTTTWGNIGLEKKKRTRTVPLEENIPCVDTRCIQFIFKIAPTTTWGNIGLEKKRELEQCFQKKTFHVLTPGVSSLSLRSPQPLPGATLVWKRKEN